MIHDYIFEILKTNLPVVFSWGTHNLKPLTSGLQFKVNGFLFQGDVKVIYDEGPDTFTVRCEKDGNLVKEQTDVYFDNMIDVIDGMVERCENYEERVKQEYKPKED